MHEFHYHGKELYCEEVPIRNLARKYGTPLYVYSERTLRDHFQRLDRALAQVDHLICFAVKSNSNLAVLRALASVGSGFDIVSGGELERVLKAGGDPQKCVFAGVGKSSSEIEFALEQGVYSFNAESEGELERINALAGLHKTRASVSLRVNPDVSAGTHKKITTGTYENKFGVAFELVEALYGRAAKMKNLLLRGVQMHIGSQITQVRPFETAVRKMIPLVTRLKERHGIEFFSIGGGLGIMYQDALESGSRWWWNSGKAKGILTPQIYASRLLPMLKPLGLRILIEPGRFISGNAGILVTRVEYVKRTGAKNFLIVDAAMNDLIRPAFYDAYHEIVPVRKSAGRKIPSDVVGPICESGDFFCHDRPMRPVRPGEYLALLSAGAYGSVMASNYNSRPIAAEVMVNGKQAALVRERQKTRNIWAAEKIPAWLKPS